MDWREVTIYTTTEGIGPVEAVLEDNGIEGYVLEDAADFEEFLKDTEIYWDYVDEDLVREKRAQETCLKIYLSDDEAGAKQYAALRTSLKTSRRATRSMPGAVWSPRPREGLKGEARRQFFLSGGFAHNAPRGADTLR